MELWTLPAAAGGGRDLDGLGAALVFGIGTPDFGTQALGDLNRLLPVASWSVYRLAAPRPPAMYVSGSHGIPDTTQACWAAYQAGLYRTDRTFAAARRALRPGGVLMTHVHAAEIDTPHRERIYRRHGMRERLSLVGQDRDGMLAVNLYRHDHQPGYRREEIRDLGQIAATLFACAARHISLNAVPAADTRAALLGLCGELSARELDVCERIARGMTQEGIAADLGVSAATVKTYRNRAFARLGIHFRSELFALLLRAGAPAGNAVAVLED